jgi:hypothetical protein
MGCSSTNDIYGIDLWRGLSALDDSRVSIPWGVAPAGMKRAFGASSKGLNSSLISRGSGSTFRCLNRSNGPLLLEFVSTLAETLSKANPRLWDSYL